jgi:hypothetical protein
MIIITAFTVFMGLVLIAAYAINTFNLFKQKCFINKKGCSNLLIKHSVKGFTICSECGRVVKVK